MRFSIVNLGCKVNRVESDGFAQLLAARGGSASPLADADVVVVNTCTVTGEAEKKTRKAVRHALRESAAPLVIVTGCAAAIDARVFEDMSPRVRVVPKAGMALFLEEETPEATPSPLASAATPEDGAPHAATPFSSRTRVGVKVQDGCDNACTYCIVHVARGRATSRPAAAIRAEVLQLAEAGVREIVLTGINLGSYRDGALRLADLLELLLADTACVHGSDEAPPRLRISSVEPMDIDDAVIDVLARADGRVCRHLHLPLQAGSTRVLAEMARPYSAEEYRALVARIRAAVPQIALTTDIIVGFPGETDEDFAATCDLARACGFSKIHVFPYSQRTGTPAAARPDQIDPAVKAARARELRALAAELRRADYTARVGNHELALVEEQNRAMTESYYEVCAPAGAPVGTLVDIEIPPSA